jgi:WD40 repeat protein
MSLLSTQWHFPRMGQKLFLGVGQHDSPVDVQSEVRISRPFGHEDAVYSVAFSPDGSKIVSGSEDNTIRLWDVQSGSELAVFKGHESESAQWHFPRMGQKLFLGPGDKRFACGMSSPAQS